MQLKELKVGDEVAVSRSGSYDVRYSFNWFVTKITTSGQVTIRKNYLGAVGADSSEMRFNNRGIEMGDRYRPAHLEFGAEHLANCKKAMVVEQLRLSAAAALNQVRLNQDARRTWSTETMVNSITELEEKLAAAKAAVAKLTEINAD